jgi:hypothetical protein
MSVLCGTALLVNGGDTCEVPIVGFFSASTQWFLSRSSYQVVLNENNYKGYVGNNCN